jgi:hypothetical protein
MKLSELVYYYNQLERLCSRSAQTAAQTALQEITQCIQDQPLTVLDSSKVSLHTQQQAIDQQFEQSLKKYDCFGLDRDPQFMDLLFGMLEFNPIKRISPDEII